MKNQTPESVLLIGAGGHAKVVLDAMLATGQFEVLGLLDSDPSRTGSHVLGVPVLGDETLLQQGAYERSALLLCIGDNARRLELAARYKLMGRRFLSVCHPTVSLGRETEIGDGTVILAGAVANPGTSIGAHCIVNTCASIDHDCRLADGVHVSPGARLAGGVCVGKGAHIGIGASVLPGVSIGALAKVGAGAVVLSDVPEGVTVVGVPAKPVQARDEES